MVHSYPEKLFFFFRFCISTLAMLYSGYKMFIINDFEAIKYWANNHKLLSTRRTNAKILFSMWDNRSISEQMLNSNMSRGFSDIVNRLFVRIIYISISIASKPKFTSYIYTNCYWCKIFSFFFSQFEMHFFFHLKGLFTGHENRT